MLGVKSLKNRIKKIFNWLLFIKNNFKEPIPIYVENVSNNGLRLHLGAGEINIQGWVNLDARNFSHTHHVVQDFKLSEYADESIQEIYLCHVLEHFSFREVKEILGQFQRKLRTGGVLRLSVPDFNSIVDLYLQNERSLEGISGVIMGGQDYEYNFHKSLYNFHLLSEIMQSAGFRYIVNWDSVSEFGVDIKDWSSGQIVSKLKNSVPISLNLKGIKP